jgi:large subunit ribosomal protein L15
MEQYQLKKPESVKKRKRVGCGHSAGGGKTCGRGMNGQMSRSGSKKRAWFEGGQMPLQRRVPKRGFNNYVFATEVQIVNVSQLDKISAEEITPESLAKAGIIRDSDKKVKILGNGDLTKSVKVTADAFSQSAQEKITKAGGEVIIRDSKVSSEASA